MLANRERLVLVGPVDFQANQLSRLDRAGV